MKKEMLYKLKYYFVCKQYNIVFSMLNRWHLHIDMTHSSTFTIPQSAILRLSLIHARTHSSTSTFWLLLTLRLRINTALTLFSKGVTCVLSPRWAASGILSLPSRGRALRLDQCWVGWRLQRVGGTVWYRWERARSRPQRSRRSPSSLAAGPRHSRHLQLSDGDAPKHRSEHQRHTSPLWLMGAHRWGRCGNARCTTDGLNFMAF